MIVKWNNCKVTLLHRNLGARVEKRYAEIETHSIFSLEYLRYWAYTDAVKVALPQGRTLIVIDR